MFRADTQRGVRHGDLQQNFRLSAVIRITLLTSNRRRRREAPLNALAAQRDKRGGERVGGSIVVYS